MGYSVRRYAAQLPQHGVWQDAFTPEEIEKIIFLEKIIVFQQGLLGTAQRPDKSTRNSEVAFIAPDEHGAWIFDRLAMIIPKINYDLFMLDIEGIEAIQYTKYSGEEEQFYDWHLDSYKEWRKFNRKISGVLLLSDPDEYEGGELEIIHDGNPNNSIKFKPDKGHISFFASNMPHKVHPVTKGIRRSLVFWVEGIRE